MAESRAGNAIQSILRNWMVRWRSVVDELCGSIGSTDDVMESGGKTMARSVAVEEQDRKLHRLTLR
ncbi:hypothetical protein OROMI_028153 [Orobanche minor]